MNNLRDGYDLARKPIAVTLMPGKQVRDSQEGGEWLGS